MHPDLQALYGSFIHSALQRAVLQQHWNAEHTWMRLVQQTPKGRALSLALQVWKTSFSAACLEIQKTCAHPAWHRLFRGAQQIVPEMEIVSFQDPEWIRARLDLFIEHPDFCWVIDYKTTSDTDPKTHEGQLNMYRTAITRYRPNKPVRCGIWFTKSCSFVEISAHAGS